jgi:hypothetical protein
MSEKTLEKYRPASAKQLMTLIGRLITGMAPLEIGAKTAQFWIDNPEALNYRCAAFAEPLTVVQVMGYKLGTCRGLGSLINAWWGVKFNVYALDFILFRDSERLPIDPLADVVIVDTVGLYKQALVQLEHELTDTVPLLVVVTDEDVPPPPFDSTVTVVSHKKTADILNWVAEYQVTLITAQLKKRILQRNEKKGSSL